MAYMLLHLREQFANINSLLCRWYRQEIGYDLREQGGHRTNYEREHLVLG